MRALLVVNPMATSTTSRTRDVIEHALSADLAVRLAHTEHRGHAAELAAQAVADGLDAVVVLGGDGTVNEVVNGLLTAPATGPRPALAVVPGGNANVFARTLGLPNDPVEATGALLDAARAGRRRTINLGTANDRYFTFCCGMGYDAEVIERVERRRAAGRRSTNALYVRSALTHFFVGAQRRRGPLTLHTADGQDLTGLCLAIVSNTSPWTYLGSWPITPSPRASFRADLDLFALDGLGTLTTLRHLGQIARPGDRDPHGRRLHTLHDVPEFTITATTDVAIQVDGDLHGHARKVVFRSVRDALDVIA